MRYPFNEPTTFIGWKRVAQVSAAALVATGVAALCVVCHTPPLLTGPAVVVTSAAVGQYVFSLDKKDGRAHDCDHECAERHLREERGQDDA